MLDMFLMVLNWLKCKHQPIFNYIDVQNVFGNPQANIDHRYFCRQTLVTGLSNWLRGYLEL